MFKNVREGLQAFRESTKAEMSMNGGGGNIGGAITKGVVTFAVCLLVVSSIWGAISLSPGDAFYNVSLTLETHTGTAFTIGMVGVIVMGAGWIMRQLDWF